MEGGLRRLPPGIEQRGQHHVSGQAGPGVEIEKVLSHRLAPYGRYGCILACPRIHCERTTAGPASQPTSNCGADSDAKATRRLHRTHGPEAPLGPRLHAAGARRRVRRLQELSGRHREGSQEPHHRRHRGHRGGSGRTRPGSSSITPPSTRRTPSSSPSSSALEDVAEEDAETRELSHLARRMRPTDRRFVLDLARRLSR